MMKYTDMHVVDCSDLDDFVSELFGIRYNSLSARANSYDPPSQNTYQSVDTTRESYLDDDEPTVQQWLDFDRSVVDTMTFQYDFERDSWLENNTPTPDPETMIYYLVNLGHIPSGKYLVRYWW